MVKESMPLVELPRGGAMRCIITRRDKVTGRMRYDCTFYDPNQTPVTTGQFSELLLRHDVPMGFWLGPNKKGRYGIGSYIIPRTKCESRKIRRGMTYPRLVCTSDSKVHRRPIPEPSEPAPRPPPREPSEDDPIAIPLPESTAFRRERGL